MEWQRDFEHCSSDSYALYLWVHLQSDVLQKIVNCPSTTDAPVTRWTEWWKNIRNWDGWMSQAMVGAGWWTISLKIVCIANTWSLSLRSTERHHAAPQSFLLPCWELLAQGSWKQMDVKDARTGEISFRCKWDQMCWFMLVLWVCVCVSPLQLIRLQVRTIKLKCWHMLTPSSSQDVSVSTSDWDETRQRISHPITLPHQFWSFVPHPRWSFYRVQVEACRRCFRLKPSLDSDVWGLVGF